MAAALAADTPLADAWAGREDRGNVLVIDDSATTPNTAVVISSKPRRPHGDRSTIISR